MGNIQYNTGFTTWESICGTEPEPKRYTLKQAVEITSISIWKLRKMIRDGVLDAVLLPHLTGLAYFVTENEVKKLIWEKANADQQT